MDKQMSALKYLFAASMVASSFVAIAPGISQTESTIPRREDANRRNREAINQQNPNASQNQLRQEPGNTNVGPIDDDPMIKFCFYNVPAEKLDDCINGIPVAPPNEEVEDFSAPSDSASE